MFWADVRVRARSLSLSLPPCTNDVITSKGPSITRCSQCNPAPFSQLRPIYRATVRALVHAIRVCVKRCGQQRGALALKMVAPYYTCPGNAVLSCAAAAPGLLHGADGC